MRSANTLSPKQSQALPLVLISLFAAPHLLLFFSPTGRSVDIAMHLVADFVVALWLTFFYNLIPQKLRRTILRVGLFFTLVLVSIEIIHFFIYQTRPNDSVYISIFNTHLPEAFEYLDDSVLKTVAIALLAPLAVARCSVFITRLAERPLHLLTRLPQIALSGIALSTFLICCFLTNGVEKVIARTSLAPIALIAQYHASLSAQAKADFSAPHSAFKTITRVNENTPETYVLVLGESTRRSHLSVYGYRRETTPRLSAISEDLAIYTNVISPSCHTHESLTTSLNFPQQQTNSVPASVIDLMNQANFKTFWISNQVFFGRWNTPVATLAKRSQHVEFLNPEQFRFNTRSYDTVVLDPFQAALDDPAPKKLIVVHLRGTHAAYHYRYPETFKEFEGIPPSCLPQRDNAAERAINQYDTAVRFTDSIVSDIITRTKNSAPYSALLFFSDHGEELYDFRNFAGHTQASPSRYMFEIPFIVWMSEQYKEKNQAIINASQSNLEKPFVTSELVDTLQDLFGVHSEQYQPGESILSAHYQPPESRTVAGISFNYPVAESLSCDQWRG